MLLVKQGEDIISSLVMTAKSPQIIRNPFRLGGGGQPLPFRVKMSFALSINASTC